MEIKVEKLPKSRVKLTITVSPIAMGEYFSRVLERLSTGFSAPGFRPGKAPLPLMEKQIGQEKIETETLEMAVPLTYFEAIKKENLTPLENPKVDIKEFGKGKRLVYEAKVDVLPEVKLGDYKKLKVKAKKKKEIDEKAIDETLKQLQRQTSDIKIVDRAAKKGDLVEIDFKAFTEGKPIPSSQSQNHPVVIGQGQFVPEFEEQLIGMKKDGNKEFSLKFTPEFHNKEIAGKEINFKVLMHEVKEIILPEINDALAVKFGKKDLKSLKDSIKDSLRKDAEKKEEEELEQQTIKEVADISETELPESLVSAEIGRIVQNLSYQVQNSGLKFEDYLKNLKKSEEELIADLRKPAEQNVKISLVLGAIRKKENIEVSSEAVEQEVKKLEEQKIQINDEVRQRMKNMLEIRKTVDKLKAGIVLDKH